MSLLIEGVELEGREVSIAISGETIEGIGNGLDAGEGATRLSGEGLVAIPPMLNAHTHAAMTLFRGYADDLPLMEWLEGHIWPAEERLEEEDVYWGTRLACLEMIRTGTTRFWDMYWHPDATARAVRDAGLRAVIGAPLIDLGDPGGTPALIERALEGLDRIGEGDGAIAAALAPHAIYTVSFESLEAVAGLARDRGLPIHIHLSETEGEVEGCIEEHGCRPAELLDRAGALGPNTLLAHCVWLDRAERELIADRGATVVTNPHANMKLAVGGPFDLPAALAAGIPVALGTDGAGSNNALDMFSEAKTMALGAKQLSGDASSVPAAQALEIARGLRAPMLGSAPIEPGGPADLLLVRRDSVELALGGLDAGLAYAAGGSVVDTTIVAGRVLMRAGAIEGAGEVIESARERARRVGLA